MKNLSIQYTAEFNYLDSDTWHRIIDLFQDANLYQTFSYDRVRFGRKRVDHMVLRKEGAIVAAAQIRIYHLPLIKTGIAYMLWGPMWRLKGAAEDAEVFCQAIRALRNEYSLRSGLVLRIYPYIFGFLDSSVSQILIAEGYQKYHDRKNHRTLVMDLHPTLSELRAGLDQKWRNCLNRAEKNDLEVFIGEEGYLFDDFKEIYDEMVKRKELVEFVDLNNLKLVQKDLPPNLKLKVILCRLKGVLSAGAIFSVIGNYGVYLIGATSNMGMKIKGSYLVQWAFVKWLKENGFRFYDLNGINPITNPGTYHFKRGLAGKYGSDVEFLGKFQVADNPVSSFVVNVGELLVGGYRRITQTRRFFRNSSDKGF